MFIFMTRRLIPHLLIFGCLTFGACKNAESDAATTNPPLIDSIESSAHSHTQHLLQASDFCTRRTTPAGETVVRLLKPNQIDSILRGEGFEITASEISIADNYDQSSSIIEISTYTSPENVTVTLNESTITITCPDKAMVNAIGRSFVTFGFLKKGSSYGWPRVGDLAGIRVTTTPTTLTISAPNAML